MQCNKIRLSLFVVAAAFAVVSCPPSGNAKHKPAEVQQSTVMKREEIMVMNLTRGQKSAKTYLVESIKSIREMQDNLDRAQHQVEQVDAAYAKVRRRPDDRTMQTTADRLKAALSTAKQLEQQLQDAEAELKADIRQTLIR